MVPIRSLKQKWRALGRQDDTVASFYVFMLAALRDACRDASRFGLELSACEEAARDLAELEGLDPTVTAYVAALSQRFGGELSSALRKR